MVEDIILELQESFQVSISKLSHEDMGSPPQHVRETPCQHMESYFLWSFTVRGSSANRGEDKELLSTIYNVLDLPLMYFSPVFLFCLRSCGFFQDED